MTQDATYSLLSAGAYKDIRRPEENQAPLPEGWVVLNQFDETCS